MLISEYVEDAFVEFYLKLMQTSNIIPGIDQQALDNFYGICSSNKSLTEKQGAYVLRLMKSYGHTIGKDYSQILDSPRFKHSFRVVDMSTKVFIDTDSSDNPIVCMRFPFAFKERFAQEFEKTNSSKVKSYWDSDKQVRVIDFYSVNLVRVHEFAIEHGFEIDETFLEALAAVESTWADQDSLIPKAVLKDNSVALVGANDDASSYFEERKSGDFEKDLFLAKCMGYPAALSNPETVIEKIVSSKENRFWAKDARVLLKAHSLTGGKTCIIIDRNEKKQDWIAEFVRIAEELGISRSTIKVCFREENKDAFNLWVKEQGLGGKVDEGEIYLFEHKPAKWVFKDLDSIKIVATTMINPPTSSLTKDFLDVYPCVIYLTPVKPTTRGTQKIVEL